MHYYLAAVMFGLATMASASDVAFTIFLTGSSTEFYDMPINAVDGGFWINRQTKQSCPEVTKGHCEVDTHTVIHGSTDEKMSITLGSMVPGGQDIYLTTDGVLGYTVAHSNKIPEGATRNLKGFIYEPPKGKYVDVGRLTFSEGQFAICGPSDPTLPTYQLFIFTGKVGSDCKAVEIGTRFHTHTEQVWQYD